jgi:hypothetical protein
MRARRRVGYAAPSVPQPVLHVRGPRPLDPAPEAHDAVPARPLSTSPLGRTPNPRGRAVDPPARTPPPRWRRPRASVTTHHPLNSPPRAPRHSLLTPVHASTYTKAACAPSHAHATPSTRHCRRPSEHPSPPTPAASQRLEPLP